MSRIDQWDRRKHLKCAALPPESVTCRLDLCKRFAHCRSVSRPFIKIVVTCVDAALEDQVRDRGAERRAAACWHDGVALRYDERRRHEGGSNELNGRHAMAEKKADRSPPVEILSKQLQRVEGRDQNQPSSWSVRSQVGCYSRPNAESDGDDSL